jgi:hypothetical protein
VGAHPAPVLPVSDDRQAIRIRQLRIQPHGEVRCVGAPGGHDVDCHPSAVELDPVQNREAIVGSGILGASRCGLNHDQAKRKAADDERRGAELTHANRPRPSSPFRRLARKRASSARRGWPVLGSRRHAAPRGRRAPACSPGSRHHAGPHRNSFGSCWTALGSIRVGHRARHWKMVASPMASGHLRPTCRPR